MAIVAKLQRVVIEDVDTGKKNVGFRFHDDDDEITEYVSLTSDELKALSDIDLIRLVAQDIRCDGNTKGMSIFEDTANHFGIRVNGHYIGCSIVKEAYDAAVASE